MGRWTPVTARVVRVNGRWSSSTASPGAAMFDVVALGDAELPGEVVAIDGERVTVQAYEYTGGLARATRSRSRAAAVGALGPGLLGGVFDGLLRPLTGAGTWLTPGSTPAPRRPARWAFTPRSPPGATCRPATARRPSTTAGRLPLRVLVPPGVRRSGRPGRRAGGLRRRRGRRAVGGVDVPLTPAWPVRRPRPCRERLTPPSRCTPASGCWTCSSRSRGAAPPRCPGGFGTGKTMLLQQIAKWCDADVIVYVGCGERGNEMADVVASSPR